MFNICGALLFTVFTSVAFGMNEDPSDKVKAYLKTRTDIIKRDDPLSLKDIERISLMNAKYFIDCLSSA